MSKTDQKTEKQTYIKCLKCGDEIFWNTHKKLTYCKCGAIYVDGCEDYIRIGGKKEDHTLFNNMQTHEKKIINELGNEITVRVTEKETHGVPGIVIFIAGPTSDTENHITLMEAEVIYQELGQVIKEINLSKNKVK